MPKVKKKSESQKRREARIRRREEGSVETRETAGKTEVNTVPVNISSNVSVSHVVENNTSASQKEN